MIYIEAVKSFAYKNHPSIFLGGGISNCPNWQNEMIHLLKDLKNLVILNPRRKNFPSNLSTNEAMKHAEEQIKWEFEALKFSKSIMFWFSTGSDNPIVLFEYGKELGRNNKRLFVGCDPKYSRILDVEIQTNLERKTLMIHKNLKELSDEVKIWYQSL